MGSGYPGRVSVVEIARIEDLQECRLRYPDVVWPEEHEELTVWADALQAEGDPLGQLVALGLRAEQLRRDDPDAAAQMSFELELGIDARLEDLLGRRARSKGIRLDWQLGVVRGLTLRGHAFAEPKHETMIDRLSELLVRPAMRFLDHLHITDSSRETEVAVLVLLCRPDIPVRPRRVILGSMPRRFRVLRPLSEQPVRRAHGYSPDCFRNYQSMLTALVERGVIWLSRDNVQQSLPWSGGEQTERLRRLEALLAEPWSPRHTKLLGAALWDTSIRVRRRLIAAIPQLPDAAAPLLSSLLAIQTDGRKIFGDLVDRSVSRAIERPAWIRALAHDWQWREPWVATALADASKACRPEVVAALPHMRRQFQRAYDAGRWHAHATIAQAIERISAC